MRVIGLISGTSVDGIDAAIADIEGTTATDLRVTVLGGTTVAYDPTLRERVLAACAGHPLTLPELAALDDAIAETFAAAAQTLTTTYGAVDLIGSHGQTVFHRPPNGRVGGLGYSLQLGRGEVIARLTGCTTASNFRAADIAAGGEGAPLVPPVDGVLLRHPTRDRCVQNLGGIGNVTVLPARDRDHPIRGWDTGPSNSLIDLAVQHFSGGTQSYDHNGAWAAQGSPCLPLVETWMTHPYFEQTPPKSTGRELFGWDFFARCLRDAEPYALSAADMLATLTEFTAVSIASEYQRFLPRLPDEVLLCGGGSRNAYLRSRIQAHLPDTTLITTDEAGVPADLKEAIAFAVLAYWRYHNLPGNLPSVTGARQAVCLGDLHWP